MIRQKHVFSDMSRKCTTELRKALVKSRILCRRILTNELLDACVSCLSLVFRDRRKAIIEISHMQKLGHLNLKMLLFNLSLYVNS